MWEPGHLRTLWASVACYRDSLTFFYIFMPAEPEAIDLWPIKLDVDIIKSFSLGLLLVAG
jgi:hypothetical protein